jgi:hypothetical protein
VRRRRELWQFTPGELERHPARAELECFALDACTLQCRLFVEGSDPEHLARAWRIARAFGAVPPPAFLERLAPALDALIGSSATGTARRAGQRERRYFMLANYYARLERSRGVSGRRVSSKAKVLADTARDFATTPGALKQLVLAHEGRLGRGRKRGPR